MRALRAQRFVGAARVNGLVAAEAPVVRPVRAAMSAAGPTTATSAPIVTSPQPDKRTADNQVSSVNDQAAAQLTAQPYHHDRDHAAIVDMCKHVYGGSDYMPRMLGTYAERQDSAVLLLVARTADNRIDGIIAADLRGDMIFLFGLRVRPEARGSGVGKFLMRQACNAALARWPAGTCASSIVTATTLWNPSAMAIIGRHLRGPLCRVDMWPDSDALHAYEMAIGWPKSAASPNHRLVAHIPGALSALHGDEEAMRLLPQWRLAASTTEAASAIRSMRAYHASSHAQRAGMAPGSGEDQLQGLGDWVPGFYEVHPTSGECVQQAVAEGRLWLLERPESVQDEIAAVQPAIVGLLSMAHSAEGRRWAAGIIACNQAAVHAALLKADELQPHFVAFVHRGCLYAEGADPEIAGALHPAPPAVYEFGDTGHMVVYGHRLQSSSPLVEP